MMHPTRLFDLLTINFQNNPLPDLLSAKEDGTWKRFSSQEIKETVDGLSAGLLTLGIGAGDSSYEGKDKIAIIAKNRPEWLMIDLSVQQIGAVLTPIYPTININELQFILQDARVKVIFVNDQLLYEKVFSIKHLLPDLKHIFSLDKTDDGIYWKTLINHDPYLKEKVSNISSTIKSEDLATIIYTSGTTGKPKGVMLSHSNILSNVIDSSPAFPSITRAKALSFLPLNHIFERMITYLYLYHGTSIYYAESLDTIADNLREIKPELFTTVPRLLEKVYEKIMAKGNELKGIKKMIFFWAHRLAARFDIHKNNGLIYNFQLSIANKLVFSKWREALGNNITCIVSGGAACQVRLIKIFGAAKITILEGYGLTETSPVISVNRMDEADRYFGTVGPLIKNVEVKIASDGEILCKGPNVMIGYYKNHELTAASIEDGWYKTGDIGELVNGRFLKITDRKKEIFKTSGGKYVAPMVIENKIKESRFIENIIVIGAGKKYVSALIIPSFTNMRLYCKEHNIDAESNLDIVNNPTVIVFYENLITELNSNFNHVEQIKKFKLLANEWNIDNGELTPKMSLKRKVIEDKYSKYIDELYDQS